MSEGIGRKYVRWNDEWVEQDQLSPEYYVFPGGVEVRQISSHLTGNGAQALQYVARSCRLDGENKGGRADDLRKAQMFIQFEIDRLEKSDEDVY